MQQNFKVIAGLNDRFRGYLQSADACVFNILNGIMTTSNDFTTCRTGTGRCSKNICLAFSLVHISFSKNLAMMFPRARFGVTLPNVLEISNGINL